MVMRLISTPKKINYNINMIWTIICYLLFVCEVFLIKDFSHKDDSSLYLMFIPLIPSFVLLLTKYSLGFETKLLRNYSTGIYFSHYFIRNFLTFVFYFIGVKVSSFLLFGITLLLIMVILTILYKLDRKIVNYMIK